MACFNCESTSSAMVITSSRTLLKSTLRRLFCRVLKILTCRIRDSSTIIAAVEACFRRRYPCLPAGVEMLAFGGGGGGRRVNKAAGAVRGGKAQSQQSGRVQRCT